MIIFQTVILERVQIITGAQKIARELKLDSPLGIVDHLKNSYVIPTSRLQDTWVGLAGIRIQSNFIVRYWTLFYTENCARLSDFFANGNQGDSCNPTNGHQIKWALWRNPLWNTRTPPPLPPVIQWRCMNKHISSFLWTLPRMWPNWSHGNFQGVWDPELWTQNIYKGGF